MQLIKTEIAEISNNIKILFRILLGKGKLPDFLVIGSQKCGTTYLWEILRQHPEIEMAPHYLRIKYKKNPVWIDKKEIGFFWDKRIFKKGVLWYKSLFNKNDKLQGEANPSYYAATEFHERMYKIIPNAKLILLIRNPVNRAFSAFNHMVRTKRNWPGYDISKNFSENMDKDIKSGFRCGRIISYGFYIKYIENLQKYYSRDQLLIIVTEHMRKYPERTYETICNFLGVKKTKLNLNKQTYVSAYLESLDKNIEEKLYSIYEPYNEELYKFLGYRIKEWENVK